MSCNGSKIVAVQSMNSTRGGGWIYRSVDGGVTWTQETQAGQANWYGVSSSCDGTRVVAVQYNDDMNQPGRIYVGAEPSDAQCG